MKAISVHYLITYHIVDLKRQNRLKVGTDKPKLKVKTQSVSDDDARKRLFEVRVELAGRRPKVYSDWEDVNPLAGSSMSLDV